LSEQAKAQPASTDLPTVPAAGSTPPLAAGTSSANGQTAEAKIAAAKEAAEAAAKMAASERMKLAHEARRDRELRSKRDTEFANREADLKQREAALAERRRNPKKFLEAEYGPDWYDTLTKVKVEGVPTGDLVVSEMEAWKADYEKRLEARDAHWERRLQERDSQADVLEQQAYESKALEYIKASAEKYPLIHAFDVTGSLPGFIYQHFLDTSQTDSTGYIVEPGELLTPEKASDMMEKTLAAKIENAHKVKQPQNPAKSPEKTFSPRRSLSTDVTATQTSNGKTKPKTDDERLKALKARWAYEEVQKHLDSQNH
jgi:hypothetical protein